MPTNNDAMFKQLKQLLLNENEQRIEQIETRLTEREARIEDSADIFVEVVDKAVKNSVEQVETALAKPIKNQFRNVAENETDWLAETLTPAFLPMMRKLIASSIESAFDKINNLISGQASIANRTKWRFKSLFTGMTVSEIALNDSIEYRVEEAYLLNSETGLLIDHVAREASKKDPDGVSAMLVALQDFVRDTFAKDEIQPLQQVRLGSQLVNFIYQGKTSLAYVAQGTLPLEAREHIENILARLIANGEDKISTFDGSALHQEIVHPYMEDILSLEQQKRAKAAKQWPAFLLVGLLTIVAIVFSGYKFWQKSYYQGLLQAISSESGWNILSTEYKSSSFTDWRGGLNIKALKDDAAVNFDALYELPELLGGTVNIEADSYVSKEPNLLLNRLERFDVKIAWVDEQFVISDGSEQARNNVKTLVDFYGLQYSDITVQKKSQLGAKKIVPPNSLTVFFKFGDTGITAESETLLKSKIKEMNRYCADVKKHSKKSCEAFIEVYSDSTGSADYNETLRFKRFSALQQKMVKIFPKSGMRFAYKDAGTLDPLAIISFGEI